jgi:hypothetical protein
MGDLNALPRILDPRKVIELQAQPGLAEKADKFPLTARNRLVQGNQPDTLGATIFCSVNQKSALT